MVATRDRNLSNNGYWRVQFSFPAFDNAACPAGRGDSTGPSQDAGTGDHAIPPLPASQSTRLAFLSLRGCVNKAQRMHGVILFITR
jgi:hypothetical protein